MIMWNKMIWMIISYFAGFFVGRKYEKDSFINKAYGVLAEIDKNNQEVESVTYYYSERAYEDKIRQLKESGVDYREQ
jgi:hypothetical protein